MTNENTTTSARVCCYCGCEEEITTKKLPWSRYATTEESNFGNCDARGMSCCNACWSLKYPTSRIKMDCISAAGVAHEHSLMRRGKSMADSPQLKFKWPKLSALATA